MAELTIHEALDLAREHLRAARWAAAEGLCRGVLGREGDNARALHYLGVVAHEVGRHERGAELIGRAVELVPEDAEARSSLGKVLRHLGRREAALAACRRAVELDPGLAEGHYQLGHVLRDLGELDGAMGAYGRVVELVPGMALGWVCLGNCWKDAGRMGEAIGAYRRAAELEPGCAWMGSNLIVALHYDPGSDAASLAAECAAWNVRHAAGLAGGVGGVRHGNVRDAERRLKVGYVSPDFRDHPVGRFMLPLLRERDRERFEVFAYVHAPVADEVTERLRGQVDGWRNVAGYSEEQVAELIRADGVDVLVDLALHTSRNGLLVFARRPAPVQVSWLGYCSTTGLTAMDYRLSDPWMDPVGGDETVYAEETVRLPETYWCYEAVGEFAVTPLPAGRRGRVTFGCLNNFCKVSGPALGAWARILCAVRGSELVLHAREGSHRERTVAVLEGLGVERGRVRFVGRLPLAEYVRVYEGIDVGLDPFPFGGGMTTCHALWMGVPVVSLAGRTGVGRAGASILANVGLEELVARTVDEYVGMAAELAGDLGRLSGLRAGLRERMVRSLLMDARRFARHVEGAYREMWRRWCANNGVSRV